MYFWVKLVQKSANIQNMGQIALEDMQFYAYHGVYEEEQIIGNNYVVDIYIETTFDKAAQNDDIFKTINYETVFLICQAEMKNKYKLLETVAQKIMLGIKYQYGNIKSLQVRVRKLNPIPDAQVGSSYVEVDGNFVRKCPRCNKPFVSYNDKSCWCVDTTVHPETLEHLKQEFKGCLCKDCLSFYAG